MAITKTCVRSILTSLWGGLLFTTAVLIQHYTRTNYTLSTVIIDIGWVAMVTGFSFVLYSRLHLLKPNKMLLRVVLCCIIIDGVLFHVPVVVTTLMGNVPSKPIIGRIYSISAFTEIVFSVQETVLASMYIYLFLQYTKDSRSEPETKRTLYLLIGAECAVLSTDLILNALLYTEFYLARTIIQAFISMLKLKVEFIVLNTLVKFATAKSSRPDADLWLAHVETPETPKLHSGVHIRSLSRQDTVVPDSPGVGIGTDKRHFSSSSGGNSPSLRESV
jgi:hypothetical protein